MGYGIRQTFFGPLAFDDEGVLEPAQPLAAPDSGEVLPPATRAKRGRPKGSLGRAIITDSHIRISDVAYLRALIEGVDREKAAKQYLPSWAYHDPGLTNYTQGLFFNILRKAALERDNQDVREWVATLFASLPTVPAASVLALPQGGEKPDYDSYLQEKLEQDISEEDARAYYIDTYGPIVEAQTGQGRHLIEAAVSEKRYALQKVSELLTRSLGPDSDLITILDHNVRNRLKISAGITTISGLARTVNTQGARWFATTPGLGRVRAARIIEWLVQNEERTGVKMSTQHHMRFGPPKTNLAFGSTPESPEKSNGLYLPSFEAMAALPGLDGEAGEFRGPMPNALGVNDDVAAIRAWINIRMAPASQHTLRSYKRSILILFCWAMNVRKKALSSLTAADMADFRDFLQHPPPGWICQRSVLTTSPDWRPFRGGLDARSVRQALAAISSMYKGWQLTQYITINPASVVASPQQVATLADDKRLKAGRRINIDNFLDGEDLTLVVKELESMPDQTAARRLRAALALLVSTGMRRAEACSVNFGDFYRIRDEKGLADQWVVRFVGKGGVERTLPVRRDLIEALEAHYQDRLAMIKEKKLPESYADIPKRKCPVLSILRPVWERKTAAAGDTPASAVRGGNATGALSEESLYSILKGLFRTVATTRAEDETQRERILSATTHWLRHTFAHQALATPGTELPTVQLLLGHKSISTTAIYVKADFQSQIQTVRQLPAII